MTAPIPPGDDFATPVEERYYEDYVPGATHTYGARTLSEEEILDFATPTTTSAGSRASPLPASTNCAGCTRSGPATPSPSARPS